MSHFGEWVTIKAQTWLKDIFSAHAPCRVGVSLVVELHVFSPRSQQSKAHAEVFHAKIKGMYFKTFPYSTFDKFLHKVVKLLLVHVKEFTKTYINGNPNTDFITWHHLQEK